MSGVISTTATDQRYRALLVMIFGIAAVLMAAVGIFGVVARAVARRSRELAIRLALGAETIGLKTLVLKRTLVTGGLGIVAGLVVAGSGSRLLAGVLFGVEPSDPVTFLTVTGAVLVMCIVAGYLPARRLMQLQPARVLKEE